MRITLEQQQKESDILALVEEEFGTEDLPYKGITYIMPDGKFLDLRGVTNHSDVEKFLIDSGLSDYEYKKTQGSQTMFDLGCLRCDTVKWYIVLPERQLTSEQYDSLLIWLDSMASSRQNFIEVYADGQVQRYRFSDVIPDEIVDKIRRYYIFGTLYEHKAGSKL